MKAIVEHVVAPPVDRLAKLAKIVSESTRMQPEILVIQKLPTMPDVTLYLPKHPKFTSPFYKGRNRLRR